MRLGLKYSRGGAARFLSHLDMQRAFGRAVRRAGLDAQYSQGFNPHIVMSFASPLSVGYATQGDYLEIGLVTGAPSEAMEKLNAVLPPDIRVKAAFTIPEKAGKLMALCDSADYMVRFYFDNADDCVTMKYVAQTILSSDRYEVTDRKGRAVDMRPLLLALELSGGQAFMRLKNASGASLNPATLTAELLKDTPGAGYEITRTECYINWQGKIVPMCELGEDRPVKTE